MFSHFALPPPPPATFQMTYNAVFGSSHFRHFPFLGLRLAYRGHQKMALNKFSKKSRYMY